MTDAGLSLTAFNDSKITLPTLASGEICIEVVSFAEIIEIAATIAINWISMLFKKDGQSIQKLE